jgi:hypothetical protein
MKIDPLSIPLPDLGNPEKSNADKEENKVVEKTEIKQENPDPMSIPLPEKDIKKEASENLLFPSLSSVQLLRTILT